jgi:HEAT repeat protein
MGVSMQRRSIRELKDMLREPDQNLDRTCCAIIALGDFGASADAAVPVLADNIRAGQEADRRASRSFAAWDSPAARATAALGQIGAEGNPKALAILAGLIETPEWTVGPLAASELARLGPKAKPTKPALEKALKDPREGVRSSAREALASIGGP